MTDDQDCAAELEKVDSSSEDGVDAKPDRSSIISSILFRGITEES
ncbi:caspase 7, isoform CRA_c [Mus musculus]|nr:caspase 7, isoform CRA_c [Mus musculus]